VRVTWRVELPYAVFAIDTEGGRVVEAPPIARWMIGKPLRDVRRWVKGKRGRIEPLRVLV
jgi:hypothetical protein